MGKSLRRSRCGTFSTLSDSAINMNADKKNIFPQQAQQRCSVKESEAAGTLGDRPTHSGGQEEVL
jgi:hypothetical protein